MIFPEEYKYVGVSNTLKKENNKIYFLSRYVIEINNKKDEYTYKIIEIEHEGKEILRTIKKKKNNSKK